MSERIDNLKLGVELMEGCHATHVTSVPVHEVFRGQTAWEGVVEVFDLIDHPKAKRAYAWGFTDEKGQARFVHVLNLPPVTSPQTAVKAYVASLGRNPKPGA